jgi:hypothetical protein
MRWLLATLLVALALAGCADSGNLDREKPIKLAVPTGHILSLTKSVPRKSFLARAEAANSKADASESGNNLSLMECASDACKFQCSPRVEKHARPKWCMYFKEPHQHP